MSEIQSLPKSWAASKIDELCVIVRGVTFPASAKENRQTESNICCLRTSNVQSKLEWKDIYYIDKKYVKREEQELKKGDILMSMANSYELVGKVCTANEIPQTATFGAFLTALRPAGRIDPRYFYYFLNSSAVQKRLRGNSSQTTNIANISVKSLKAIDIVVAPFNEQRRIADKLDTTLAAVEACKQKLNNAAETIKRFRQSVLAAAVSGELTREWREERGIQGEWEEIKTADVCERIFDGPFGSNLKSDDYTTEGKQVVRLENIGRLTYNANKNTYISEDKFLTLEKHILQKGDLLFSSFVTEETRTCLLPEELSGHAINKADVFCLRANPKKCLHEFALILLSSPQIYSKIEEQIHGATRPRINLKQLKAIELPLPSIEEQTTISKKVSYLYEIADNSDSKLLACNGLLEDLIPATLAKAFRGELVPQDPNDEPASVLLGRIKAQREAEAATKKPAKRGRKKKADPAQLVIPEGIADNHLAKVLEECGVLSELALLAASELEPEVFQLQLARELNGSGLKQVDLDSETAYADAAWEEEV